jgi:hypothetical protein
MRPAQSEGSNKQDHNLYVLKQPSNPRVLVASNMERVSWVIFGFSLGRWGEGVRKHGVEARDVCGSVVIVQSDVDYGRCQL